MATIRQSFSSLLAVFSGDKAAGALHGFRYARQLTIAVGFAAVVGAGFYGYRWYASHREQQAHKIFTECMHEYARAQKNAALWPNVEAVLKAGYEKHGSSQLAPFFLTYRADTLLKQNKFEEALEVMDQAMKAMPKSSPLYNLYATKCALMRIDHAKDGTEGLKDLESLARNEKNLNRDTALYYLGLYHWSHNDLNQAKAVWQELVALPKQEKQNRSPWAVIVEEKLAQIV